MVLSPTALLQLAQTAALALVILLDRELASVARIELGVFLAHSGNAGKSRPALQGGFQLRELLRRAAGINLDAPVAQISGVAANAQLLRFAQGEHPVAHTLHRSGNKIFARVLLVRHECCIVAERRAVLRRAERETCRPGPRCAKLVPLRKRRKAAIERVSRIQLFMIGASVSSGLRFAQYAVLCGGACFCASAAPAQEGPLTPPPEHNVRRVGTEPAPPAPPAIAPEEIIRRFAQKEDQYIVARTGYGYKKTVRLQEFAPDGQPAGQLLLVTEAVRTADGRVRERTVEKPQSTLQYLEMGPEDFQQLARMPAYPLVTANLGKYDLKYLGKEKVDELDCYIFQAKPKAVERAVRYFDGIVWVDTQYLEVVKTYGRWVNDLGDTRTPTMPFSIFETYREDVDGKYWLPDYMRSDATLNLKDQNVNVRLVVKWTDLKPLAAAAPADATPGAPTPSPNPPQPSAPTPTPPAPTPTPTAKPNRL